MVVFTAIATTAFVWMTKRPHVESDIMQFGMPSTSSQAAQKTIESTDKPQLLDEKPVEELKEVVEETVEEVKEEVSTDAPTEEAEPEKK